MKHVVDYEKERPISSLLNMDQKRRFSWIMHQQFKRKFNVAIVHGQALHSFIWLNYVRNTPQASSYAFINNNMKRGGWMDNTNKEGRTCLPPTAIDTGKS